MEDYQISFRDIALARTAYRILKDAYRRAPCLDYNPNNVKIVDKHLIIDEVVFSIFEKIIKRHERKVKIKKL